MSRIVLLGRSCDLTSTSRLLTVRLLHTAGREAFASPFRRHPAAGSCSYKVPAVALMMRAALFAFDIGVWGLEIEAWEQDPDPLLELSTSSPSTLNAHSQHLPCVAQVTARGVAVYQTALQASKQTTRSQDHGRADVRLPSHGPRWLPSEVSHWTVHTASYTTPRPGIQSGQEASPPSVRTTVQ